MSRALASARQRRAGPEPVPVPPPAPTNNNGNNGSNNGLTLPQVIALIDTRLVTLEKFMKESQENPATKSVSFDVSSNGSQDDQPGDDITQVLSEFESRFMLLAEEIAGLKDTLMKLQTYTMDVNKMLLEERVNVLSDLGQEKGMFVMGDTTLSGNEVEKFEMSSSL
jgi:hypothetical protein